MEGEGEGEGEGEELEIRIDGRLGLLDPIMDRFGLRRFARNFSGALKWATMAQVQPFRATLFAPDKVGDVGAALCPPYDVISQQEQYRLYLRSPHNIVRLELGQDQPEDSRAVNRYTRAAEQLSAWVAEGVLREDDKAAIYVYDQHWETGKRRSFFAAVRLAEWEKREVIPHEQTLSGPKADRLLLMRHTAANLSPVYGLYEDPTGTVAKVLAEATARTPDLEADQGGGERHQIWRITQWDAIATLQEALSAQPIYIADGHHRYETALTYRDEQREKLGAYTGYEPWNNVLMCLSDAADPGLVVWPTHRLVKVDAFDKDAFLTKLSAHFNVSETPLPEGPGRIGAVEEALADMAAAGAGSARTATSPAGGSGKPPRHLLGLLLKGESRLLTLELAGDAQQALAQVPRSAAWRELDVALLHYLVIERMLGIPEAEWKGGRKIVYTREFREVLLGMESGEFEAGFFLNHTPVRQILEVAAAQDVMPQKSTFFYPKLPTGLVIHRLGEVPGPAVRAGSSS